MQTGTHHAHRRLAVRSEGASTGTVWWRALLALPLVLSLAACSMDSNSPGSDLPRFTQLPAFQPHRKSFECKQEAAVNPPIGAEAQSLFEQALALDDWQIWYDQRDYAGMARLYTQAMKLGHWKAQLNLAQMYLEGRGVEVDAKEAIRLTEDLMRQGVPAAWHRMGSLYMMGAGPLKQDDTVAYAFWQWAADMGSMESQAFLGEKLDADHDSPPSYWGNKVIGLQMLECAFAQGSALAAYSLGLSLNQSARTPEASQRALQVMHEGVKRGYQKCANYLFASFDDGDPIVGHAKDPIRARRYQAISERLRFDKHLQLPNLDRVLPLPPAKLPQWDGNPDTLIDAAKAVRVTPRAQKLSGHVHPPAHRAHIPPGQTLQVPPHLAHMPELPGFTSILADAPGATGLARASVTGYWQPRVSPARATDAIFDVSCRFAGRRRLAGHASRSTRRTRHGGSDLAASTGPSRRPVACRGAA
ncbi:TPR repeat protein [Variovorax sp. PvP013]